MVLRPCASLPAPTLANLTVAGWLPSLQVPLAAVRERLGLPVGSAPGNILLLWKGLSCPTCLMGSVCGLGPSDSGLMH